MGRGKGGGKWGEEKGCVFVWGKGGFKRGVKMVNGVKGVEGFKIKGLIILG